MPLDKAALRAG